MANDSKSLLKNHAVKLSGQIVAERLKSAGITIAKDSGLRVPKADKKSGFSPDLIKRLSRG